MRNERTARRRAAITTRQRQKRIEILLRPIFRIMAAADAIILPAASAISGIDGRYTRAGPASVTTAARNGKKIPPSTIPIRIRRFLRTNTIQRATSRRNTPQPQIVHPHSDDNTGNRKSRKNDITPVIAVPKLCPALKSR